MIIKHLFYYYIDKNTLRMRIKWNSCKSMVSFALPFKIDPTKFDKKKQRIKNNTFHYGVSSSELQKVITDYENKANDIFNKLDHIPTTDEFKKLFNSNNLDSNNSIKIDVAYNDFIINYSKDKDLQISSINNFPKVLIILKKANIKYLDELNNETLNKIHDIMIEGNYNNNYIKNIFVNIKTFAKWSNKRYNYNIQLDNSYRFKTANNDLIYLTFDELMKIYNFEFNNNTLNYVRDVFCFCSFTSLRISDAMKLSIKDINVDHIIVVTKKTSKPLKIELNNFAKAILKKYEGIEKPFASYTHHYLNNKIKIIGKICGIDTPVKRISYSGNVRKETTVEKYKLLSTHAARRTFVVNCIKLGIPIEVVMKWTGHKNYNTLKNYVDIIDEVKEKQMNKFNEMPMY